MIDFCDDFGAFGPFGHGGCVPFCLLEGKQFFDDMKIECDITGIGHFYQDEKVKFYPNPSQNLVRFDLPDVGALPFTIRMTNIAGQIVKNFSDIKGTQFELNVSDLHAGVYLVEVKGLALDYKRKIDRVLRGAKVRLF